jgi:hypothetical protein
MTNDDEILRSLLRSALPPVDAHAPSRDLWPSVVERSRTVPRWSLADLSVAAMIATALVMFPKWFWFLAYHL